MMPLNVFADLSKIIEAATPDDLPVLCGELERLKASLWLRMTGAAQRPPAAQVDQLLTAEQVAERLNVAKEYVYRNADRYPFTVREGRYVRFSQNGLARYLDKHQRRQ